MKKAKPVIYQQIKQEEVPAKYRKKIERAMKEEKLVTKPIVLEELPAKLRKRLKKELADLRDPYRYVIAGPFAGMSKRHLSVYNVDSDTYLMWNIKREKGVYPHSLSLFKRRWTAKAVRDELVRRRPRLDKSMRVVKVKLNDKGQLISSSLKP